MYGNSSLCGRYCTCSFQCVCRQPIGNYLHVCMKQRVAGCLCVYARLRQECQEFCLSPWHRPEWSESVLEQGYFLSLEISLSYSQVVCVFLLHSSFTICNAECQSKHCTRGVNGYMHMKPLMSCSETDTMACCLPFGHAAVPVLILAGPRLGNSPVPSIVQCLARKDGTDDFYQLKVSRTGFWGSQFFAFNTFK